MLGLGLDPSYTALPKYSVWQDLPPTCRPTSGSPLHSGPLLLHPAKVALREVPLPEEAPQQSQLNENIARAVLSLEVVRLVQILRA